MATDEFETDDEYEFDDFDDFMDDGETEKRPPAGNAREAVEYAIEDVSGGIKDTFTKSELTNNLKTLTSNLAPSALNDEMKKITGIKQALNDELGGILEENKDKVANITGFIMSKTKEGGLINKLASSINSKVVNNELGDREESVESVAAREVSNQLDTAMLEINKAELDNIQKFSQQEALNRIYTQLLKQDAFNKNITTVFYRKSLEYQYISLTTNKRLLDVTKSGLGKIENALSFVVKNTGLPDIVKQRSMEAVSAEARNRMINSGLDKLIGADGWVSKIINKIKSKKQDINDSISGIDEGIDSYKQVDEMSELMAEMGGTSKTRMFASTLPGMGAGVLGKYLGERLANTDRGSAAIDKIKDVMSNPSEMLKNVSAKLEGGGNIYTKFIRSKLAGGLGSLADLLKNDAIKSNMLVKTQDLNEAVTLDRKSLITQNEVVPSLLSKILKEVHLIRTGKKEDEVDEVKFDYNARAFSTAKDMTSLLNRKMNTVIDSGGSAKDIATMTKHILKKSGVEFDDKMMGEARSGMASYMLTGKGFKPTDLGDDFFSHFPKEIADIMRAGMDNINKADNKTSGTEKTMLRESFSKARGNIPNIEDMINAQINSGNTDLLVRNGLLKYDNKIGRYKVDEKKFNEYVKSVLASYQGKGGDYDIKERKGKSIKEDITSLVTGVADFKDNIATNLNMNEFVKNRTNIPMADSKFTLNKSGTNSMVEKLATDAVKGINLAGNKAYENKLVKATVDRLVKDIKSTSNTVGKVVTNTNLYKNAEKMMSDNKEKFTVDYAKEAMTSEIEKLKKEYNSLKDYISNPIEQETNRLTPASTMSNKPLPISKFTLNKSGTNSIAEKLAVDATRASTIAMSKLTESINTLSKNAKETDVYKNLSETYDKHKDVLSVEGVSAELSTLRNELMQFKNNISTNTNLETNRLKPSIGTKPVSDSVFTLNKSGTNSKIESVVSKGIDIASKKAQATTSTINRNITREKMKERASELKKAFFNSKLYKTIDTELSDLGVKLNTSLIRNDDIENTINLTKTISVALDTVKGKVTDASYDVREKAIRELYSVGLIDAENMIKAITNIEKARAKEVDDTKVVEKSIYTRATKKASDIATFLTKPFSGNKVLNKEFGNLAGKVTSELLSVKESKRFNKLKNIVITKLDKLGISLVKKLNNTQVLELMSIMTSSKSLRELKSNTINYLFINDLINESNLMDHMLHINNDAPIDEDTGVTDITKVSMLDRAMSIFKSSTDSRVLANIKTTREQAVTDDKTVIKEIETKLAEKEDKRVQSIVTKVIDSLGLSKKDKEKKVAGDTDKDGVRDGSWMSRVKNKVFGNKPTEKITTTKVAEDKDKSSNPMWSIAKVLLMGVPMLISGITSISGIISTISTLVGKIPELFKSTIGGLGSKVWKGFKWLSKGVFKLGSRVIAGIGGFVLDLGKTIGGFVMDLGKTIGGIVEGLAKSVWDGFKWVGTQLLDLGKNIAGAVTSAISGAYSSVKSFFSDAVDEATEIIDDVTGDDKDRKPDDKDKDKDRKPDDKDKESKSKSTDTKEIVDENDPKHKANKTKGSWWNKIKYAGSSLMKNPLARKIPVAGAILGAAYGASQLMDGDTVGGLASIGAGIIGSIPVVGTGLAMGVDYAVDKYKQWNPDINKQLYNNQTLPNITTDAADQITLNHIRKHETGKPEGKYGMAEDINDGAGISFGTYQFTEKSGNLKEYLKRLIAITNDPTGQIFLNQFKGDTVYSGIRSGFLDYLKETGDTQAGRYVQDSMYKEIFLDPAKKLGASMGITNQAAMSQLIDHSVNAGLDGAKRMLEIANGDYSPENLARARKLHYSRIIDNNPDKEKFRNGWFKRVDANAGLYMSEVAKIAATNPAAITTPVNGGIVPNQPLVGPDGKVVQPQTNTGATNTIMNTANAMVTGAMQPQLNAPVAQQPMMTATLAGATQMMSNNQSSSGMNTANLEQILKSSHETLKGIQANTTNLYSSTGPLVVALKTLTESIGKLNETIITNKGSIPTITQKEKTNTPQVIKAPMGEGVSLSKGGSLSK